MTATAKKRVGAKRNWPWSKRTYSAKTKTWTRAKGSGKKSVSYRVHSPRIKAAVKVATATRAKSAKAPATKYPALFGTAYEKLSPSQQQLVRKAMAHNKANPGKSFEDCVKAVSKRGGVASPAAVCAASKMRTEAGKSELLAAARRGKLAAMSSKNPFRTIKQGKYRADIFQTGPHEFTVKLSGEDYGQFGKTETFKTFRAAEGWARLRLHEVANPKGKLRAYRNKKNPLDAAQKLSEEFHGFPSTEVLEFVEREHYHSKLAGIGPLISLVVLNRTGRQEAIINAPDPARAKAEDIVFACFTEDGRQLEFVGGNQKIPVDALMGNFGLNQFDVRDKMVIGEIKTLTYRTKKSFEADGQEEIDFYHDLGGEHSKGVLPVLIYKPRNPSMEVAGGRYFIGKPDKSLGGVSPGIVG